MYFSFFLSFWLQPVMLMFFLDICKSWTMSTCIFKGKMYSEEMCSFCFFGWTLIDRLTDWLYTRLQPDSWILIIETDFIFSFLVGYFCNFAIHELWTKLWISYSTETFCCCCCCCVMKDLKFDFLSCSQGDLICLIYIVQYFSFHILNYVFLPLQKRDLTGRKKPLNLQTAKPQQTQQALEPEAMRQGIYNYEVIQHYYTMSLCSYKTKHGEIRKNIPLEVSHNNQ